MIEKALVGEKRYWVWLGLLLALGVAGFFVYYWQWLTGAEVSNLSRDVVWGFFIANYTFFVGVAASAVVVVLPYYLHNQKEFGRMAALGEFLAVASVAMAIMFIIVDLGQPFRAFNILFYPTLNSPFFWNMIILPVYLLLNLVVAFFTLGAERNSVSPPRWVKTLVIISIPWAISIHTVTSFVYSGLIARPFWNTAILTPRFLASAFASGPALLIILCLVVKATSRFDAGDKGIQKLITVVTYAAIANVFFILAEAFSVLYGNIPEDVDHLRYLYLGLDGQGTLVPWSWASIVIALGGIFLLLTPRVRRDSRLLIVACTAIFVSTWIDKGLVMVVGGLIPTPLGHVVEYFPTVSEGIISLGIYAAGCLIITVLYKVAVTVKKGLESEGATVRTGIGDTQSN